MTKEVILPSGAKLEITVSDFKTSKELYMAIASECRGLRVDPNAEDDVNLWKDLFCLAVDSKKIEAAIQKCMTRCTYNGLKINDDTFEPIEARDDYLMTCFEIARENVMPFTKSLYAKYATLLDGLKKSLA